MSEKRFIKLISEWVDINFPIIWDTCNETGLNVEQAVNVLNEQQATINNFEKLFSETIVVADTSKLLETGDYEIKRMVVKELIENLQKENEQLRKKLEQIYSFKGQNCRCDGV